MNTISAFAAMRPWLAAAALAVSLALPSADARAGDYVALDGERGPQLYYEEAGEGTPVVIVPGWTMTTRFFSKQLDHFADSKDLRVIVYDPRAHGRSSKTLDGANYRQHGRDLKRFIDALGLEDVVLAGWSWGGITVYSYLSQFGTDNVKGLVLIDQTPRPLPLKDGSWNDGDIGIVKDFFDAFTEDRVATMREFIPWMFPKGISDEEAEWMLAETMETPDIVAALLLYDGWMADFTATLRTPGVPLLNIVREENGEAAKAYLKANDIQSEFFVKGGHGMFYDYPDAFNSTLENFVTGLED